MDTTNTIQLNFRDIDFSLILYCLAAILIGAGGSYYLLKMERMVTAAGFFIASLAIFIYFGTRWFDGFKLRPSVSGVLDPNMTWPPMINYCPDFLNLVFKSSDRKYYCVDSVGISSLAKFESTSTPNTATNAIELVPSNTPSTYATTLQSKGVTWEGVYDGRTPTTNTIPSPPVPAAASS